MTVGEGFVAYENRTASGRVTIDEETEERYRRLLMWGGNQQGGGGNEFVFLTGLFASASGKSITGMVKPDSFNTLFALMKEANEKGTGLMFVVSGPGDKNQSEKMKGRLSVVVARPQQDGGRGRQSAPAGPFGGPTSTPAPAETRSTGPAPSGGNPFGAGSTGKQANNPPKDELESFLEGFNN